MIIDKKSFIMGLQLGRRLALWDTYKKIEPPLSEKYLMTESESPILTESAQVIEGEGGNNFA